MTDRTLSTVRRQSGAGVVRVEDVYDTTADDLWSALTDPDRLARWIATVSGDLRAGGGFTIRFTSGWQGSGRVDVCEPAARLVLMMDDGTSTTEIEAVLTPEGTRTRLVVEDRGIPIEEVTDHGAGWQVHLEDLATMLSGAVPGDWFTRWSELRAPYAALGVAGEDGPRLPSV